MMISVQMSRFLLRPLQFPFSARKSFGTAAFIALAVSFTVGTQRKVYLDAPSRQPPVSLCSVDPATSIAFPKSLNVPSQVKIPTLSLVGLGVRTVSFLGIKVYSVGFYADLNNPHLKVRASRVCIFDKAYQLRIIDTKRDAARGKGEAYYQQYDVSRAYR